MAARPPATADGRLRRLIAPLRPRPLENGLSPERRHRIEGMAREIMAEMLLAEVRRQTGLTQSDLAAKLGIKQPSLSKLEGQEDMQISTLRRIIEALGGELELVATFPDGAGAFGG